MFYEIYRDKLEGELFVYCIIHKESHAIMCLI